MDFLVFLALMSINSIKYSNINLYGMQKVSFCNSVIEKCLIDFGKINFLYEKVVM